MVSLEHQKIKTLVFAANNKLNELDDWLKYETDATISYNIDTINDQYRQALELYQQYHRLVGKLSFQTNSVTAHEQSIQAWHHLHHLIENTDQKLIRISRTLEKVPHFNPRKLWFFQRWATNFQAVVDALKIRVSAISVPAHLIYQRPVASALVASGFIAATSATMCYPSLLPSAISTVATKVLSHWVAALCGAGIAAATACKLKDVLQSIQNAVKFYSDHAIEYGVLETACILGFGQVLNKSFAATILGGITISGHITLKALHSIYADPVRLIPEA
jgi:hypothetical protein